jgi:hypothetical protein
VGIVLVGFLNHTGFCYLQGRYVPIRELFEHAIARQASKIGDFSLTDTPASYLARHPECCSIPNFQPTNSVLQVILGYRIRYIRVVYRMHQAEIDRDPQAGEFYEAYVEVTPCGTTLHAIGTSRDDMR